MTAYSSILACNLISSNPKSLTLTLTSFSKPLTNLSFSSHTAPFGAVKLRRGRGLELRFARRVAVASSKYDQDETEDDDEKASFSSDLKLFVGNLPFSLDSADLAGQCRDGRGSKREAKEALEKLASAKKQKKLLFSQQRVPGNLPLLQGNI